MYSTLNQNGMGRIVAPGSVAPFPMVKDSALSESEVHDLREKFKNQYIREKGWDPNSLTEEQLKEIYSDKRWQTPGLLLS